MSAGNNPLSHVIFSLVRRRKSRISMRLSIRSSNVIILSTQLCHETEGIIGHELGRLWHLSHLGFSLRSGMHESRWRGEKDSASRGGSPAYIGMMVDLMASSSATIMCEFASSMARISQLGGISKMVTAWKDRTW